MSRFTLVLKNTTVLPINVTQQYYYINSTRNRARTSDSERRPALQSPVQPKICFYCECTSKPLTSVKTEQNVVVSPQTSVHMDRVTETQFTSSWSL